MLGLKLAFILPLGFRLVFFVFFKFSFGLASLSGLIRIVLKWR
jgi:hypothetical protein